MLGSILDIVDVGLKLLAAEQAQHIQNITMQMRTDYAEEINKPDSTIDDARLFSIKSELRNLLSVYSTAVQGQVVAAKSS